MSTTGPAPATSDVATPTDLARRVGPVIVAASLLVLVAVLAWFAAAPTAIAGDIEDAPFTVPGTLALPPDADGCIDLVAGDGSVTTHCLDELATGGDRAEWVEVTFLASGTLQVFRDGPDGRLVLEVDPETGAVLDRTEGTAGEGDRGVELPDPPSTIEVYADGDVVRQYDGEGYRPGEEPDDDEVVLDVDGPPGYRLRDAAMSPDGAWVVAVTPDDLVIVAPVDGSAAPYVWSRTADDGWVDLRRAIRWDD